MGCSASLADKSGASEGRLEAPPELQALVASAKERLARGEAVIPCQQTGALHGNWSGRSKGFSSLDAMRQYNDVRVKEMREVGGDVLEHWQELDADFALQHCSMAGAALPPIWQLQPRIHEGMLRQTALYRKALSFLPEGERRRLKTFGSRWPRKSAEDLRAAVVQPEEASTVRMTYAAAVVRLELLYLFTLCLARSVGESADQVRWSVKRPVRMWKKTVDSFPEDFAKGCFRRCTDVIRTSLTVGSLAQVEQVLQVLEGLGRRAQGRRAKLRAMGLGGCQAGFVVERIKNRFVDPCIGGYRDLIVSLRIDGYVTELQVELQCLAELQGDRGRGAYKWFRSFQRDSIECTGELVVEGHVVNGKDVPSKLMSGRYRGDMEDGKRHGKGVLYHANGDRYEGDFFDGKKHGTGTYFYASGDRYHGDFTNDCMEGSGTYHCASGERFEGQYVEGKRHGAGVYHYRNGTTLEGEWWRHQHVTVMSV